MTLNTVKSSEADLLSVALDERPFANVALAFIEQSKRKWISADGVLIIEENGRFLRTHGIGNSLIHSFARYKDPLATPQTIDSETTWSRLLDFDDGQYGLELISTFRLQKDLSIKIFDSEFDVFAVYEDVQLGAGQNTWLANRAWTNVYWFYTANGELFKSTQKLHPDGDNITSVYASRVARVLDKVE